MSGFRSPNHTQTPNDFFDMLPDMSEAELRVTLVMIRHTHGWHKNGFTMGIHDLAVAAGLSDQGARDGALAAEERGTFRRTNPTAKKTAEWELVVDDDLKPIEVQTSTQLGINLHPVEVEPQPSGGQVPLKESIKERTKEITRAPSTIEEAIFAG